MTTRIYKTNQNRILRKSLLVIFFVILQVIIFFAFLYNSNGSLGLLFWYPQILFGIVTTTGILFVINYYINSKDLTVTLTYKTTKANYGNNNSVELTNIEIDKIEIIKVDSWNRFPWVEFEYYVFHQGDKKLKFNNFTMDIGEFWSDNLTCHINRDVIKEKRTWFPWIKK